MHQNTEIKEEHQESKKQNVTQDLSSPQKTTKHKKKKKSKKQKKHPVSSAKHPIHIYILFVFSIIIVLSSFYFGSSKLREIIKVYK